MKIKQQAFTIHQFTATELCTLRDAKNLIHEIYKSYDDNIMLQCPVTGECITIDELPRVMGILSFLTDNRVIQVSPK